jgi:AraC-like DNA-binding protein
LVVAYLGIILAEARLAWSDTAATLRPAKAKVALTDSFRSELEQHHLERLQVQEYAFLLGVSSSYLIEVVRETTGMSPKQLIDDRLALEAKRLLAHTTETVAEIALSLSFNSPSQFSRWFKTIEGISPSQFRRDHVFPRF